MSHQSRLSANDKGDNELEPRGCAKISRHVPYGCEKSRKTSAKRSSDEVCPNKCDHLPSNDVGKFVQYVWKRERKEGKDGV